MISTRLVGGTPRKHPLTRTLLSRHLMVDTWPKKVFLPPKFLHPQVRFRGAW